jgi:hypothetical protein
MQIKIRHCCVCYGSWHSKAYTYDEDIYSSLCLNQVSTLLLMCTASSHLYSTTLWTRCLRACSIDNEHFTSVQTFMCLRLRVKNKNGVQRKLNGDYIWEMLCPSHSESVVWHILPAVILTALLYGYENSLCRGESWIEGENTTLGVVSCLQKTNVRWLKKIAKPGALYVEVYTAVTIRDYCHLGWNSMTRVRNSNIFWRIVLPLSSGL